MGAARVMLIAGCVGTSITLSAKEPRLRDVVVRLSAYLENYEKGLSAVVADELYRQTMDVRPSTPRVVVDPRQSTRPLGHADRVLRSDYALTRAPDKEAWVGYRDTFEVDGKPVRDREDRLLKLLASGTVGSAARIAQESSRFNLGNTLVTRNINIPTLVLEMLHPRNQSRFSFSAAGDETIGTTHTWRIAYTEKQHPTFIRNSNGRDRVSHGFVWVDPATGEVWRTSLTWDSAPTGTITVTYGRVTNIDALVPQTMSEHYAAGDLTLVGDATYSNYRRFQTAARFIANE
jgi:hypothetical protein